MSWVLSEGRNGVRFAGYAFVDWDDTIAENIRYFNEAEEANTLLIARRTGADPAVVRQRGRELDLETAMRIGLVKDSLAIAWCACYREFCAKAGLAPDPETEEAICRISAMPYEVRQELRPDAEEMLSWLCRSGFEVTIWTAGEDSVQRRKVQDSGLNRYIHRVEVVLEKTPDRLRRAIGDRDPSLCFVVGNSIRSDILPALSLGIPAYHIPTETWAYDHGDVNMTDPNYHRVDRLLGVLEAVAQRFRMVG